MKNVLLSTLEAAAHGARLSGAEFVPDFPAKYSDEIVKTLKGVHNCKIVSADSQSSAMNMSIGAALGGKRAFLPLSAPRCIDEFYTTSFLRIPIVVGNVSRSVFSYTIKSDHNNILDLRDAGWLLFFPESVQEVMDNIMQAYSICEDSKVMLPAAINIEMPTLRETTQMPSDQFARKMIPKFRLPHKINVKNPKAIAPTDDYGEFVQQQQIAMSNSIKLFEKMDEKYSKKLKRPFGLIEKYKMDDADIAIVMAGPQSLTAKHAIDQMREQGKNIGLLRMRVARPWPMTELESSLENVKKVAVIDQNISLGHAGIFYSEMNLNEFMNNYIVLGKTLTQKNIFDMIHHLEKSEKPERVWI